MLVSKLCSQNHSGKLVQASKVSNVPRASAKQASSSHQHVDILEPASGRREALMMMGLSALALAQPAQAIQGLTAGRIPGGKCCSMCGIYVPLVWGFEIKQEAALIFDVGVYV